MAICTKLPVPAGLESMALVQRLADIAVAHGRDRSGDGGRHQQHPAMSRGVRARIEARKGSA